MPRQNIPVTRPGVTGADPVEIVPVVVDGLTMVNDGATLLEIRNQGAAPDTITIITPATASGLAIADAVVVVANDATPAHVGPFPERYFSNTDGTVWIDVTTTNSRFRAWSTRT